jgi:hypothetical protein
MLFILLHHISILLFFTPNRTRSPNYSDVPWYQSCRARVRCRPWAKNHVTWQSIKSWHWIGEDSSWGLGQTGIFVSHDPVPLVKHFRTHHATQTDSPVVYLTSFSSSSSDWWCRLASCCPCRRRRRRRLRNSSRLPPPYHCRCRSRRNGWQRGSWRPRPRNPQLWGCQRDDYFTSLWTVLTETPVILPTLQFPTARHSAA